MLSFLIICKSRSIEQIIDFTHIVSIECRRRISTKQSHKFNNKTFFNLSIHSEIFLQHHERRFCNIQNYETEKNREFHSVNREIEILFHIFSTLILHF